MVACVQQRARLHESMTDYRDDLCRFLRIAQTRQAELVVFPELGGVMVAPPLLRDFRSTLLKRADRGRSKGASLLQRVTGALARQTATWLGVDLRSSLRGLLDVAATDVWDAYTTLFSSLAREFGMVLVAPSGYLPDPADGVIRNLAAVFGADGALLGYQTKVILHPGDEGLAQAGSGWTPVQTSVGSLGLILGSDALYPEVGRVLAYQGAEILIGLAACTTPVLYQKVRTGMLARMQDNQLFGVVSFLVGPSFLSRPQSEPLVGRSAILAPQELTPRFNGVLVEMGNGRSEGVLAAEWNLAALKQLWQTSDTPLRQQLPMAQAGQLLTKLFERLKNPSVEPESDLLLEANGKRLLTAQAPSAPTVGEPLHLADLAVVGVVTRRWPVAGVTPNLDETPLNLAELPEQLEREWHGRSAVEGGEAVAAVADDETDEMDALPDPATGKRGESSHAA